MSIGAKVAAALVTTSLAGAASAQTVVEFTNLETGQFHLSAFAEEIAVLDGGGAGPEWTRTGQAFVASGTGPVYRFVRSIDGASQHFFAIDPREVASLQQVGSGWTQEGVAFNAFPHGAAGCPLRSSGGFFPVHVPSLPVYRLFAGPLGFGHRYTANEALRATLLTRGWIDEGVAFCVAGTHTSLPLRAHAFAFPAPIERMGSPAYCRDESRLGSCLAVFNLPLPNQPLNRLDSAGFQYQTTLTGLFNGAYSTYAPAGSAPNLVGEPLFLVVAYPGLGFYLDSRARGGSPYASVALHHQLPTTRGMLDERFVPWRRALPETELVLQFALRVATLAAEPGSHAYGHSTIEFLDQRSGRSFYFNVLAFASFPLGGDAFGFDVNENKPIVSASLGTGSSFGRASGSAVFRIDRNEFRHIVDAARTMDASLSNDLSDYVVANFRFKNETVGEGRIGASLSDFGLYQVIRSPL